MKTFNSRYLTYSEIAQEFVLTKNFQELLKPCHSILLGTRGCGKTTMLKMLHPAAVREYQKVHSEFHLEFYGVYIPADRQWSLILEQLDKETEHIEFYEKVSKSLVNVNILLAFIDTLKVLFDDESFGAEKKTKYLSLLVNYWKLGKNIPPIIDIIRLNLKGMIIDMKNAISESDFSFVFPYVCKSNFEDTIALAVELFNSLFEDSCKKWALCFDEMEIAPEWLQRKIVNGCLRSIDQTLLFKITATPDWKVCNNNHKSPTQGNDFEFIKCWNYDYSSTMEWRIFCDSIIESQVLSKYGVTQDEFISLLSDPKKHELNFFFHELPKVDKGFSEVFQKENYDENNGVIQIKNWIQRKKKYKYPVLLCRYSWFTQDRQYGIPFENVYLGDWLLYKMSDGNPRIFCNILGDIVLSLRSTKGNLMPKLPALRDIVTDYSKHFYEGSSFLLDEYKTEYGDFTFEELINIIGWYFNHELLSDRYNPSPITMFTLGKSSSLQSFVKKALQQGVVVKVEDQQVETSGSSDGIYRLSYMLYPYFHIIQSFAKNIISLEEILTYNLKNEDSSDFTNR